MQTYRAYFFAPGDEILDARSYEAADDRTARARAEQFCRECPGCVTVEIWERGWRVYRYTLPAELEVGDGFKPSGRIPGEGDI